MIHPFTTKTNMTKINEDTYFYDFCNPVIMQLSIWPTKLLEMTQQRIELIGLISAWLWMHWIQIWISWIVFLISWMVFKVSKMYMLYHSTILNEKCWNLPFKTCLPCTNSMEFLVMNLTCPESAGHRTDLFFIQYSKMGRADWGWDKMATLFQMTFSNGYF